MRVVYELAYSATSSSAKDSLWAGAAYQSNRGSTRHCEQSLDSQQISERDAAKPVTPPEPLSPQRARGSVRSARDRGAPRRRLKTPGGHHKPG